MGDSKVVLGLAIGTAYTRSATANASLGGITSEAAAAAEGGAGVEGANQCQVSRPEIVVNADGDRGTATIVARREGEEGGREEWLVGEAAKTAMAGRNSSMVKVWLGHELLGALQGEKKEEDEDEEEGDNGPPIDEVCSQLLQHVLEQAEAFSGESPSDCVLAIPSWFTEEHRRAFIHTANMTGLSVLGVIREPMAAFVAYKLTSGAPPPSPTSGIEYTVVFDFGYNHLDVSVLEDDQGILRLLHSSTNKGIGGKSLVEKLVSLCTTEFRKKCGCDATESKRAMLKLRRECENALKTLSTSQQADVEIDSLYEGFDLRTRLSRARFESEIFDVLRACLVALDSTLEAAGIAREKVGLLLLAGGTSRVPKLQSWLQGVFPETTLMRPADVNPEEAVAIGAAIQAQLLVQATQNGQEVTLPGSTVGNMDAHPVSAEILSSPLSFGIMMSEEKPFLLIRQGQLLPATQTVRVSKAKPSQNAVHLQIIACDSKAFPVSSGSSEGESSWQRQQVVIGEASVDLTQIYLPPDAELEMVLTMTEKGILEAYLRQKENGGVSKVLKQIIIRPDGEDEEAALGKSSN